MKKITCRSPLVALLVTILLLPVVVQGQTTGVDQNWIYVAKSGDNLWDITTRYLTGIKYWRPLQRLNNIDEPRRIPPGTHIRIPVKWSRVILAHARVKSLIGQATVYRASGKEEIAAPGLVLSEKDRITTSKDSSVLLTFADKSELLLISGSSMNLENLKAFGDGDVADTRIYLEQGRTETVANPDELPGTRFRIKTPSAVMAIRGTDFRVSADNKSSRVEVTTGKVEVANDNSDSILSGGYGMVARAGKALTPPVKLLPPPDLSAVPPEIEALNTRIDIPDMSGASGYRVQITASENFDILLHDSIHPPGRIYPDMATLPDDVYTLRVRAVDNSGLEGEDAVRDFTLNARPVPPAYISPTAAEQTAMGHPLFQWTKPEGASSYQVEIRSADKRNKQIISVEGLKSEKIQPGEALSPGEYRWRVQANDGDGLPGPYGHYQDFRVLPEPPLVNQPELNDDRLTLQWQSGGARQSYHVQISRQKDFSELLVDEQLGSATYVIEDPGQGDYFMRVSTIDEDGFQGPYSPTQSFNVPGPDRSWVTVVTMLAALLFAL